MDTGVDLYYYGARYYDANIGRFISADIIVPGLSNPQAFNRYSYVLNNPVRYTDPTGQCIPLCLVAAALAVAPLVANAPRLIDVAKAAAATASVAAGLYAAKRVREETPSEWVRGKSDSPAMDTGGGSETAPLGPKGWRPKRPLNWWEQAIIYASVGGLTLYVASKGRFPEEPGEGEPDPSPHQPNMPVSTPTSQGGSGTFGNTSDASGAGASGLGSAAGRGAGIIGDISGGAHGWGTDEAGNSVFLVSIEGESPIWVTSDSANSMLREGENLVYVNP